MSYGVDGASPGRVPTTAHELADALEAGWWPPAIAVPIRLESGETCHAQAPVSVLQWVEGDDTYTHKHVGGLHPIVIPLKLMTAVGNSMRKSRAGRNAAAQWREVERGTVFMTDRRLAVRGQQSWHSIWYRGIMEATCDGTAFTLQGEGMSPTRLLMADVVYNFVLFYRLAFNQVVRPPATTVAG